jgi:hypothetical protein
VEQMSLRVEAAFRAEVPPLLVEVCRFLYASSLSADSLLCYFGIEDSCPFDFYKLLQGVFLSQHSPFHAQETQLLTSSHLGLQREVFELVVAFPQIRCVKILLWPVWPYIRQDACRTVLDVPDLFASL